MDKNQFPTIEPYFRDQPAVDYFYFAADGLAFYDMGIAHRHAQELEDKSVTPVSRKQYLALKRVWDAAEKTSSLLQDAVSDPDAPEAAGAKKPDAAVADEGKETPVDDAQPKTPIATAQVEKAPAKKAVAKADKQPAKKATAKKAAPKAKASK